MMPAAQFRRSPDVDVLGSLLHSLCQPLTTLRCSLELALDEFTERQSETVSAALEQADRAVETVQLMREYLDVEQGCTPVQSVALAPAVDKVLGQLSVVAEAHRITLLASGTSAAVLAVNEFWLQRALRYLIGMWLEDPPRGNAIAVLLEDWRSRAMLSVYPLQFHGAADRTLETCAGANHLRQAKLAIARNVLESAGATFECYADDKPGFIIRIPITGAVAHKLSA